jgi:hypothetical protein
MPKVFLRRSGTGFVLDKAESIFMEKREKTADKSSKEYRHSENSSADFVIGKVDLSRSILEDTGDGEGDRNDTSEMDEISRQDQA